MKLNKKLKKALAHSCIVAPLALSNISYAQATNNNYNDNYNINNNGYRITGTIEKSFDEQKKIVLLKVDKNSKKHSRVLLNINQHKNKLIAKLNQARLNVNDDDNQENNPEVKEEPVVYNKVDLGMANVPVLDQGPHGSCVTFAVTAALNAKFYAGDYISQQCMLALGNGEYMYTPDGYGLSGWDGLWAEIALNRIRKHGVVGKMACPDTYPNTLYALDNASYDYLSLHKQWANDFTTKTLPTANVDAVKQELDNGHRVLFATFLNVADKETTMGYNIDDDHVYGNWKFPDNVDDKVEYLKQIIDQLTYEYIGAHEMVITGYDDELKRFKIRNSWGTTYGDKIFADNGDFYMSYEFYELMNLDAMALL